MRISYSRLQLNDSRVYTIMVDDHFLVATVTAHATAVQRWLEYILNLERNQTFLANDRLVVGIGVQWFTRPDDQTSRGETLQLCVGNRCLIFQFRRAQNVPIELKQFLVNPRCTFVGFFTNFDRLILYSSRHKMNIHMDPVDLRLLLNDELSRADVGRILRNCLGFRGVVFRKEIYTSDGNWNVETLSNEQVLLASTEAYCAFVMGVNCRAWEYRAQASGSGNQDQVGELERLAR